MPRPATSYVPQEVPGYVEPLSEEAEAARLQLAMELRSGARGARGADGGFRNWKRAQGARRLIVWFLSFAFMAPGVIFAVYEVSPWISGGAEVVGLVGGFLLRRERRRYLKQVATWEEPADDDR